jgi:hypothetical protein
VFTHCVFFGDSASSSNTAWNSNSVSSPTYIIHILFEDYVTATLNTARPNSNPYFFFVLDDVKKSSSLSLNKKKQDEVWENLGRDLGLDESLEF